MIKGVVFSNQYVSAAAHASLFRMMVKDGIIRGCGFVFAPNNQSNAVQIMDGMFVLCGRVVEIQGQEIILTDETNTKPYIRIRGVIDMTKASTKEVFEQFSFKVDPDRDYADNIADFDALTKEDINSPQYSSTGKYEVEFAILKCTNGKPTSTARTLPSASGEGGSGETEGSGPPAFTYRVTNNGTTTNYTYTPDPTNLNHTEAGIFEVIDDDDGNWRVKFLTSGVLVVNEINGMANGINVFLVGGGGGGGTNAGGGGGYTKTGEFTNIVSETEYPISIGDGGASAKDGSASSAFDFSADGGKCGNGNNGGNGGSGGGSYSATSVTADTVTGGTNGGNGRGSNASRGLGQGSTTGEFGEDPGSNDDKKYAGGGAGSSVNGTTWYASKGGDGGGGNASSASNIDPNTLPGPAGTAGTDNKGGGGGPRTKGGSGIVIIRNKRAT